MIGVWIGLDNNAIIAGGRGHALWLRRFGEVKRAHATKKTRSKCEA